MTRWSDLPRGDREAAAAVVAYLAYAEAADPRAALGSWTAGEALDAACHLLELCPRAVRREFITLMRE